MSVMLQECNYALPYASISCCLPKCHSTHPWPVGHFYLVIIASSQRLVNQPVKHPVQDLRSTVHWWIMPFDLVNFLWKGFLLQQQ